jgi:hypothetical protein
MTALAGAEYNSATACRKAAASHRASWELRSPQAAALFFGMQDKLLRLQFQDQALDPVQRLPVVDARAEDAIAVYPGVDWLALLTHVTVPHWRGEANFIPQFLCLRGYRFVHNNQIRRPGTIRLLEVLGWCVPTYDYRRGTPPSCCLQPPC